MYNSQFNPNKAWEDCFSTKVPPEIKLIKGEGHEFWTIFMSLENWEYYFKIQTDTKTWEQYFESNLVVKPHSSPTYLTNQYIPKWFDPKELPNLQTYQFSEKTIFRDSINNLILYVVHGNQ